jgi:endonuclease/exonuclease/phosphatase family metal-dependent hydrolase
MTGATWARLAPRAAFFAAAITIVLPAALLAQPGQVSNPVPANGATNVPTTTALSWSAATHAVRYDVRLGTTVPPPLVVRGSKETTYQPTSPLQPGTTYYWRVDARGKGNSITSGPAWTFSTAAAPDPPPSAPASPSPADGTTGVSVDASLAWAPSGNTTGYDVAFGAADPPPVLSTNQPGTTYDPPGDLAHGTTYYWQVTARGPGGTASGAVWSLTTATAPPSSTFDRLRLMTWNVRSGQNLSGALNIDAQVALMADAGAHIIILQEVTITTTADLPTRYESGLEALTGQEWYAVWAPAPRRETATPEGNLLLTTLPIIESSTLEIDSVPSDPTWYDTKRSAVRASVAVNGSIVNVFGTHLAVNATQRAAQMQTLLAWIATFPAPRVVGGDFNMVQGEAAYNAMANALADVWPPLAFGDQGFTMDRRASANDQPGRIDYWWHERAAPEARATEVWVVKTSRSDHHALIVDVMVQ